MVGQILNDRDWPAAWNMAADQYLLDLADRDATSTLRFYGWSRPSISLGYFQSHESRQQHPSSRDLDWVRRATGGGAIVHDRELTYSLTIPASRHARGEHAPLYQQVHRAIIGTFADLGVHLSRWGDGTRGGGRSGRDQHEPWLCFQRRTAEDLVHSGYKLVGSAQRRGRQAILQHGSILLGASPHAPELPGVGELTGKRFSGAEVAERLTHHLEKFGLIFLDRKGWNVGDVEEIEKIERDRFLAAQWQCRR